MRDTVPPRGSVLNDLRHYLPEYGPGAIPHYVK